ncbi:hypothetical protein BH10BAC2_BH10BAC2_30800 [soil metagenome]
MYIGNLSEHIVYDKIKKQQLYKEDRFHAMLLCLQEGEYLKPHHSTTDAFLMVLEGLILFIKGEEEFQLVKGDMFTFKADETHAVRALQNASLLLVK